MLKFLCAKPETMKRYHVIERLVVKVGTGFIFDKNSDGKGYFLREDQLDAIVEEISIISEEREVAVVTSGAIATAAMREGLKKPPEDDYKKAQLSSKGQIYLMDEYFRRFERYGKECAQCLITYDDIKIRKRRRNLRRNQEGFFHDGVIAIYNENDLIAIEEITFGDNDILAAMLTRCIDADLLVMLSYPIEGLGSGGGESKKRAREILNENADPIPMEIINTRYERDRKTGLYKPKIRKLF